MKTSFLFLELGNFSSSEVCIGSCSAWNLLPPDVQMVHFTHFLPVSLTCQAFPEYHKQSINCNPFLLPSILLSHCYLALCYVVISLFIYNLSFLYYSSMAGTLHCSHQECLSMRRAYYIAESQKPFIVRLTISKDHKKYSICVVFLKNTPRKYLLT